MTRTGTVISIWCVSLSSNSVWNWIFANSFVIVLVLTWSYIIISFERYHLTFICLTHLKSLNLSFSQMIFSIIMTWAWTIISIYWLLFSPNCIWYWIFTNSLMFLLILTRSNTFVIFFRYDLCSIALTYLVWRAECSS
jgi:hypothetical protein